MRRVQNQSNQIVPFNYSSYFDVSSLFGSTIGNVPYVKLNNNGIKLVGEYYSNKYGMEKLTLSPDIYSFINTINSKKEELMKDGEIRLPFVIGSTVPIRSKDTSSESKHSTPAVYVKKGNIEAILIFDSRISPFDAKLIADRTGKQVYTVDMQRQSDLYSCHSDALIFLRELTGIDQQGNYLIPDLLEKMNPKDPNKNPAIVKLMDRLLITAQLPEFLDSQKEGKDFIHTYQGKPETINDFLKRYPEVHFDGKKIQPASSYLRKKGLKYANLIEIQYYLNQLQEILKEKFTNELRNNFIKDAKIELKSQGEVNYENLMSRKGLFELTEQYLAKGFGVNWSAQRTHERIGSHGETSNSIILPATKTLNYAHRKSQRKNQSSFITSSEKEKKPEINYEEFFKLVSTGMGACDAKKKLEDDLKNSTSKLSEQSNTLFTKFEISGAAKLFAQEMVFSGKDLYFANIIEFINTEKLSISTYEKITAELNKAVEAFAKEFDQYKVPPGNAVTNKIKEKCQTEIIFILKSSQENALLPKLLEILKLKRLIT